MKRQSKDGREVELNATNLKVEISIPSNWARSEMKTQRYDLSVTCFAIQHRKVLQLVKPLQGPESGKHRPFFKISIIMLNAQSQ